MQIAFQIFLDDINDIIQKNNMLPLPRSTLGASFFMCPPVCSAHVVRALQRSPGDASVVSVSKLGGQLKCFWEFQGFFENFRQVDASYFCYPPGTAGRSRSSEFIRINQISSSIIKSLKSPTGSHCQSVYYLHLPPSSLSQAEPHVPPWHCKVQKRLTAVVLLTYRARANFLIQYSHIMSYIFFHIFLRFLFT